MIRRAAVADGAAISRLNQTEGAEALDRGSGRPRTGDRPRGMASQWTLMTATAMGDRDESESPR